MRVYVVGFAPAYEGASLGGGFDWYPRDEFERAADRLGEHLGDAGDARGRYSLTFVPLEVPDAVAYRDDDAVDRDAVTAWIDANLHLVEVGLDPSPDDVEVTLPDGERGLIPLGGEPLSAEAREAVERLLDVPPSCVIYGCDRPADDGPPIPFALPGGGEARARVCLGHRKILSANTLRGVSLDESPAPPALTLESLGSAPRQTRPSAILRRPDPEAPVSELTTAELLREALERTEARRLAAFDLPPNNRIGNERDLERATDAIQDAISLHNRAVYRERGIFAITDAERTTGAESGPRT